VVGGGFVAYIGFQGLKPGDLFGSYGTAEAGALTLVSFADAFLKQTTAWLKAVP
jgi:hypothetical protein